jgi:hypothetical protein
MNEAPVVTRDAPVAVYSLNGWHNAPPFFGLLFSNVEQSGWSDCP